MSTPTVPDQPVQLSDDVALTDRLASLLVRAERRDFWMFFLDADDVEVTTPMACGDLPADPHERSRAQDLGVCSAAELLSVRIAGIMTKHDIAQVVFVWERRGGAGIEDDERRWARALAEQCAARGARVRCQFVLHDRGIRVLAPDDYL